MQKVLYILLFCGFSLLSFAGNADKEKITSKQVSGKITDVNGEAVPGAKIFIPETNETFFADLDGSFKFSLKNDKVYSITINTIGFEPLQINSSKLSAFSELSLNAL